MDAYEGHVKPPLLVVILLVAFTGSCVKRAVVVQEQEVRRLDTGPVRSSAKDVGQAVDQVVDAGHRTKEASDKVRVTADLMFNAIDRAEAYAKTDEALHRAFGEVQTLAKVLTADIYQLTELNTLLQARGVVATQQVRALEKAVDDLEKEKNKQDLEIEKNKQAFTLIAEELRGTQGTLQKTKDKLSWWKSAALITWVVLLVGTLIRLFGVALIGAARANSPLGRIGS